MVTRATANGSGGNCAPGPTPETIYNPGDVVRYRVGPSGLAAIAAQTVFVIEKVSQTRSLYGCEIAYLIAAGNWRKWATPANLVRIDPPAPSAFTAVPAPPTEPGPVAGSFEPVTLSGENEEFVTARAEAAEGAANRPELSPDQRAVLVMIYAAGAVGLAFSLSCEAARRFGRVDAALVINQLVGLGLARRIRGDEESQGGWGLTTAGEEFAEPLWMNEQRGRKANAASTPPESGDMLADPLGVIADGLPAVATAAPEPEVKPDVVVEERAGITWYALGLGGLESLDRRFAITREGSFFTALDTWTGEQNTGVAVLLNAQEWCGKRHREGGAALEWHHNADVETGARGPHHSLFYCRPSADGGTWHAIDTRFPLCHPLRGSPHFFTADEAKRWCEVRAACKLEPNNTLTWVSPIPF